MSAPAHTTLFKAALFGLCLLGFSACRKGPAATVGEWSERGEASYYADKYHGRTTASGEPYDKNALTAAHRTLPFGTKLEVTNLDNGKRATVRINDRGPFSPPGRVIDLSRAAAAQLDLLRKGTARVELRKVE